MRPGRLRHRITIQEPASVQDAVTGEMVDGWSDVYADLPAECLSGPGSEAKKSGAITAEVDLRVTTRWFSGFDPTWRIVWDGFAYNVRSIEFDITGRRELRLTCKNTREAVTIGPSTGLFLETGAGFLLAESGEFLIQE